MSYSSVPFVRGRYNLIRSQSRYVLVSSSAQTVMIN